MLSVRRVYRHYRWSQKEKAPTVRGESGRRGGESGDRLAVGKQTYRKTGNLDAPT